MPVVIVRESYKFFAMSSWNDFNATHSFRLDGALKDTSLQTFSVVLAREAAAGRQIHELANTFVGSGARVYMGVPSQTGFQVDARGIPFESILSILTPHKSVIAAIAHFDPAVLTTARDVQSYCVDPEGKRSGFYP